MRYCLLLVTIYAFTSPAARAGIVVSPGYLFLNSVHRTVSLTATNDGDDEREVWMEVKFGYEISDDSGKIFIQIDTLAQNEPSAAAWIECYPRRFNLKPGESQTVRVMASPPRTLGEGEYWSRVIVVSKTRQPPPQKAAAASTKPGLIILYEQSLPFHYRIGTLSTGVVVDSLGTSLSDTSVNVVMKLTRVGNASYWGSRTTEFIDNSGRTVYKLTRNTGVYKSITLIDRINRTKIPPGEYIVNVQFVSEGRTDIPKRDLIHSSPVRTSRSLTIP